MKKQFIKILTYLLNIGTSGLLAWFCLASYAIWVEPPFESTRDETYRQLNLGILKTAGILSIIVLPTFLILTALTSYIFRKIYLNKQKTDKRIILIINSMIISIGLIIGIIYARIQLVEQIEDYFNK